MEEVIYVIDDDDAYRSFVVQFLTAAGYQTFDFSNAKEFYPLPSLIILHA